MSGGTIEYQGGFQNLAGRIVGETVQVLHIARRTPTLVWQYRCTRCSTSGIASHTLLVANAFRCPNASCGRSIPATPTIGWSMSPTVGIRSADSAARRYEARTVQPIRPQNIEPSPEALRNADPSSVRAYLDSRREERK
jgi:hypothetical protein